MPALLHSADQVTPDWLTEALRDGGAMESGTVVDASITPIGTGQMADTVRIGLTYNPRGSGPKSVIAKFASHNEQSRATGLALRAYEIEIRFYQEVASLVTARVPASYLAKVDPETGWFTLVLEDIDAGEAGDQIEACGPDRAAAALEELAGLHAPCWELPQLAALSWLNRSSPDSDAFMAALLSSVLPGFLERYGDALAPEHARLCERFVADAAIWFAHRVGPRTASHGDFRLDNLLFVSGDPRPVVVDWQTLSWSGCTFDVAYFIGGCLSVEDRRAHEVDLLTQYHQALCARGVSDYSLEQLHRDARRDTFGGLLMAILASMVVERTDRGDLMFVTSAGRHAQHAIDSGAVAFLEEAGD